MASHTTISPEEAADRLAIRELIDACATARTGVTPRARWLCSPKTSGSSCSWTRLSRNRELRLLSAGRTR